jgi:hypothetical protein
VVYARSHSRSAGILLISTVDAADKDVASVAYKLKLIISINMISSGHMLDGGYVLQYIGLKN